MNRLGGIVYAFARIPGFVEIDRDHAVRRRM